MMKKKKKTNKKPYCLSYHSYYTREVISYILSLFLHFLLFISSWSGKVFGFEVDWFFIQFISLLEGKLSMFDLETSDTWHNGLFVFSSTASI